MLRHTCSCIYVKVIFTLHGTTSSSYISSLWICIFSLNWLSFSTHCTWNLAVKSIYVGVHFSEETPLSFFQRSLYPTVSFLGYIVKPSCKYLEAHFKYVSSLLYRCFSFLSPPFFQSFSHPPPPIPAPKYINFDFVSYSFSKFLSSRFLILLR